MMDGMEYLPFVRPYPHRWHYMAKRMLLPMRQAGGFRPRLWVTEPMLGAPGTSNSPLLARHFRDFYLPVVPGSEVWMIGVTGSAPLAAEGFFRNGVEVEIIDTCTKEAWFRTSEDTTNLAGGISQEAVTTSISNAATFTENEPQGFVGYFPADHRVIVGTGVQMVRIVVGNVTGAAEGVQVQVALFAMEKLEERRDAPCDL